MSRLSILTGDCRDILPTLEPQSVQCCVTSPPYWGLRDYGTAQWEGGDGACDHVEVWNLKRDTNGGLLPAGEGTRGTQSSTASSKMLYRDECGKCGARRIDSQIGLESSPEEYIANMVAVFREVWRVLRLDGTLWLNMGDSYASSGTNGYQRLDELGERLGCGGGHKHSAQLCGRAPTPPGLKPKDLCMMPARLAMALQADGWYLRSEIVWHKPNPMPESVTDRPTKAHEMIYLLAKQERYFYDAEAIREPHLTDYSKIEAWSNNPGWSGNPNVNGEKGHPLPGNIIGRNKRTVWTIATQPYAEAHFATFPEEIPKLCILAGSKPGDTVLDPFAGSGTTGKVALELGRKAVLIELNPAYIELAEDRTFVTPGFL
jgi:DNA modification methylase